MFKNLKKLDTLNKQLKQFNKQQEIAFVKTKIYYIIYKKLNKFIIFIIYCFDYYISLYNCYFYLKNINNLLLQLICLNIVKSKKRQKIIYFKVYNYFV